ncbi:unnamed protein product [Sphagnum jensenii]|uniref:Uncharacterized protein n=1 Tax=Sphagnum jensenii TaxID=128206 RepID=A0ABP0VE66_9BRYO
MFSVKDGQVFVDGVVAPKVLGRKIEEFANEGLPYEPLVKFAKNLQSNPSFRAVNELYQFLEKNNHPITENGCFIAYKKVRHDFKDIYTGTMDNSVGQVVEMQRNQVNEDPNQTCSFGLHVANWDYAKNQYGSGHDTMLEVEVNPADVVAVPVDYNQAKMRTCKYKVLSVVEQELSTSLRITDPTAYASSTATVSDDEESEDFNDVDESDSVIRYCEDCECELDPVNDDGYNKCASCEEEDECGDESCPDCHPATEDEDYYPWNEELE